MANSPDVSNEFSGNAGNVIQTGAVHGDVHVHRSRVPLPRPRQLPPAPTVFVDREPLLRELDVLLTRERPEGHPRRPIAAIAGQPGVGKTALAVYWATMARQHFPDGDLFVDMHGYDHRSPVTPERVLDIFLRAMGVPPEDIPDDLTQRSALFRSMLDGKRILVLIDNAPSSEQVRALLPSSPECCTVVTSRSSLQGLVARDGAKRMRLDVLSLDDSLRLVDELVGGDVVARQREHAVRLVDLCGRLPLAITVAAERAVSRPTMELADLVREIAGEQRRLDALASAEDHLSDVRAVFSWSYHSLPADLRRMFRQLSLHARPEVASGAVAAMVRSSERSATRQLRALADVHLVEETAASRFRMHDLLRSYASELVQRDDQQSRIRALRRVLIWYLYTGDAGRRVILPYSAEVPLVPADGVADIDRFETSSAAMAWFDAERLNILAALRQASDLGQFDLCWKLAMVVSGFFELRSYWGDWEANHHLGLSAARTIGDQLGEATNTQMLGDAAWRLGRVAEARRRYQRSRELAHHVNVGWLEGFAIRGLGLTYEEEGVFDIAMGLYRTALDVFRRADVRRGEAMSLLSIGRCAEGLGDLRAAIPMQVRAIAILEEIGDAWSTAWAKLSVGRSMIAAGQLPHAIDHLQAAAHVFGQFVDYRSSIGTHVALGEAFEQMGDRGTAVRHWERAVELGKILGDDVSELEDRIRRSSGR